MLTVGGCFTGDPVSINTGQQTLGFYFNETGLQWDYAQDGFAGWIGMCFFPFRFPFFFFSPLPPLFSNADSPHLVSVRLVARPAPALLEIQLLRRSAAVQLCPGAAVSRAGVSAIEGPCGSENSWSSGRGSLIGRGWMQSRHGEVEKWHALIAGLEEEKAFVQILLKGPD